MRSASRVALVYTVASVFWIVITDWLVATLELDTRWLQLGKGIFFVLATGAILWVMLERESRRTLKADEALLDAKRQIQAVIDTSPMAIIGLDRNAYVTMWNPAAERIFGWTAEEVMGTFNPIVPDDRRAEFDESFEQVLAGAEIPRFRGVRRNRAGDLVDVLGSTATLRGPSGDVEGGIGLFTDISDQVAAEHELKSYREHLEELVQARTAELSVVNEHLAAATQVKSEFLANMSHELRTPLNSIIGFSGAMLQGLAGELSEEQQKQLSMVYRSGKHLLELINDILDLSKIEAGRYSVEVQEFDVVQLIESVVATFELQVEQKAIEVQLVVPDEPVIARTDRTKVRQILINIVGNAVKFTSEGSVGIEVTTSSEHCDITVRDTGPGIPSREYALIFDEFTQSTRHADEKPKGTGLGLAISRRLARMLGGDIGVVSTVGEGSTFTVRVPLEYVEALVAVPDVSNTEVDDTRAE